LPIPTKCGRWRKLEVNDALGFDLNEKEPRKSEEKEKWRDGLRTSLRHTQETRIDVSLLPSFQTGTLSVGTVTYFSFNFLFVASRLSIFCYK
jgi:hypothetical protein